MNRDARGVILAFVAIVLLRLSLANEHLLYVKDAMRPWLVISGVLLAALSANDLLDLVQRRVERRGETLTAHDAAHAHDAAGDEHGHGPRFLPWLLVTPFLVVFAVGPSPLGAFMASRQTPQTLTVGQAIASVDGVVDQGDRGFVYPPLPDPVDGAVELTLDDFISRAGFDSARQLEGVRVRMLGFVTDDPATDDDQGFHLTRFALSCCAADGFPVVVRVVGTPSPPVDTWLAVEGTWLPHEGDGLPEVHVLEALQVTTIETPENPYL